MYIIRLEIIIIFQHFHLATDNYIGINRTSTILHRFAPYVHTNRFSFTIEFFSQTCILFYFTAAVMENQDCEKISSKNFSEFLTEEGLFENHEKR